MVSSSLNKQRTKRRRFEAGSALAFSEWNYWPNTMSADSLFPLVVVGRDSSPFVPCCVCPVSARNSTSTGEVLLLYFSRFSVCFVRWGRTTESEERRKRRRKVIGEGKEPLNGARIQINVRKKYIFFPLFSLLLLSVRGVWKIFFFFFFAV